MSSATTRRQFVPHCGDPNRNPGEDRNGRCHDEARCEKPVDQASENS
jgi:hypothetical protein